MIIRSCGEGHLYDAEHFKTCPHCKKKDSVSGKDSKTAKGKPAIFHKDIQARVEQSLNEVKKITKPDSVVKTKTHVKTVKRNPDTNSQAIDLVIMASMPDKIQKNQDFAIDVAIYQNSLWREGADMLTFKIKNGARDIKTISLPEDAKGLLKIIYKDEVLLETEVDLSLDKNKILTFLSCITDTRDRRLHMIKLLFEFTDGTKVTELFLQPGL